MISIFRQGTKAPENIGEVLEILKRLDDRVNQIAGKVADIETKGKNHIQKIGIVRFNPFKDAGGDQSFSVAILDEENNGVVITGLYGRGGNRIYAKPIKNGISTYQLSEEEKKAIEGSLAGDNKVKA